MAAQTSSGLSQEVSTYYEKVFLARAEYELVHKEGGQMRTQPKGEGKQVNFTRHTPLATVTTALTEGSNPSEVDLTASTVSAALAEYGTTVKISKFLSLISIDQNNKEKIEVVAQNAGETLDQLTRNAISATTTVQFANSKAALSSLSASDTMDADELRKAVRTLKNNKAIAYKGRFGYIGKLNPYTTYDLMGDTTWVNAKVYSDVEDLYKGEVGALHGVRIIESKNPRSEASTTTVYSNFVHGSDAFGCINLDGDSMKVYIVPHTQVDSGNPAGRFSLVSWAASYTCKVLNDNWIVNIKTGATA